MRKIMKSIASRNSRSSSAPTAPAQTSRTAKAPSTESSQGSRPGDSPHDWKASFGVVGGGRLDVMGYGNGSARVTHHPDGKISERSKTYDTAWADHDPKTGIVSFPESKDVGAKNQAINTRRGNFTDNRVQKDGSPQGDLPAWSKNFSGLDRPNPNGGAFGQWEHDGERYR